MKIVKLANDEMLIIRQRKKEVIVSSSLVKGTVYDEPYYKLKNVKR